MSDHHLDAAIAKIRRRVTEKPLPPEPAPLTLVESVGLLLATLDQRPARLNAGISLELTLVRDALAREAVPSRQDLREALAKVRLDANFHALRAETIERVRAMLPPPNAPL